MKSRNPILATVLGGSLAFAAGARAEDACYKIKSDHVCLIDHERNTVKDCKCTVFLAKPGDSGESNSCATDNDGYCPELEDGQPTGKSFDYCELSGEGCTQEPGLSSW